MKNISEAELEVMQVLWEKGESTSLEIISEVKKKKDWKNNTIMTLVSRLVNKEFIDVIRENKSLLIYRPLISEYDYKSKETNNFIEKLYDAITRNNCDIAAATIIRKREKTQKYRVHYIKEEVFEKLEDKLKACRIPVCCYVWNKLYKADLVKNYSSRL